MIRWFLATLHLSHLQADDNYACHLLTAKIFQIGLSENVVHLYTYGHFVEKRPVPMQWNWCLPTNFRYLSPNGAHQVRYDVAPGYDAATPWLSGATTRSTVEPW